MRESIGVKVLGLERTLLLNDHLRANHQGRERPQRKV